MRNGTKVVAYEGTNAGSIFYKRMYGEGHCNILSIRYPLSSLVDWDIFRFKNMEGLPINFTGIITNEYEPLIY